MKNQEFLDFLVNLSVPMHGNVYEWMRDCWNDSYVGAPTDGRAWVSGNCSMRVIRGGAWYGSPGLLRSAFRGGPSRSYSMNTFGLRLAHDQ